MPKPVMLIVTGPQGSGNHLYSKILSSHPEVYGWRMKSYWEGHHEEPFNSYWQEPDLLKTFDWSQSQYYFTSISCPYFKNKKPNIPKYKDFIKHASEYCKIKIAIIGRDKNILNLQQKRVRKMSTLDLALENFEYLYQYDPLFISQELYQLYGNHYLQSLSKILDFPISEQQTTSDANTKYITDIGAQPLDNEVYKANNSS